MRVLSSTVKVSKDVGGIDGACCEPGLYGSVGFPGQRNVAVRRLIFPAHLDDVTATSRAEPVARDAADLRDTGPVAKGVQERQVPQPKQAARVWLLGEQAHLLGGDPDARIGLEAVLESLDGNPAHAVELVDRPRGDKLFLLRLHHHVPDGGEHAVDRVGGELLFNHLPGALSIGNQVDALHQVGAPLREDGRIEGALRAPGEAQVVEKILSILLAGRGADSPRDDGIVPAEELAGAPPLFRERHRVRAIGRHDNGTARLGQLHPRAFGILHRMYPPLALGQRTKSEHPFYLL